MFTKPFDLNESLRAYDLRLDSPKPNLGEVKRAWTELKRLLNEGLERVGSKDIFNSINEDMAKENLIRSPEMIRIVREELKKYAAIAAKITEFEFLISDNQNEEKWLDQFIEALYTGTITKKGALFVYDRDPEEDSWEPFANLLKSVNDVEYEVYKHFRQLDEKSRDDASQILPPRSGADRFRGHYAAPRSWKNWPSGSWKRATGSNTRRWSLRTVKSDTSSTDRYLRN